MPIDYPQHPGQIAGDRSSRLWLLRGIACARQPKSAFVFAYVLSGEMESKVNDEAARVYCAGGSWSEAPGAVHSISKNASKTRLAKLFAVFVVDTGDKQLVTPVK